MSLKLLKPEVLKSLIVIDREGGHALVDRELWEEALWAKVSVEELKLSKSKAPKLEELKW